MRSMVGNTRHSTRIQHFFNTSKTILDIPSTYVKVFTQPCELGEHVDLRHYARVLTVLLKKNRGLRGTFKKKMRLYYYCSMTDFHA